MGFTGFAGFIGLTGFRGTIWFMGLAVSLCLLHREVSLNYCSQNGGNLYRAPNYNGNLNIGPRIIGNLDQSPIGFQALVEVYQSTALWCRSSKRSRDRAVASVEKNNPTLLDLGV